MKNKKGIQLNEAFGAVLAVVLVAVLVIVAIFMFETIGTSFSLQTVTFANQSFSDVNNVTATFSGNISECNFQAFTVSLALDSSADIITTSNYTVAATNGSILGTPTMLLALNGTDWDITGSYKWGGEACTATDAMTTQFGTYPALVGLVGTIVFLGLVIGVLVASFIFGRKAPRA